MPTEPDAFNIFPLARGIAALTRKLNIFVFFVSSCEPNHRSNLTQGQMDQLPGIAEVVRRT